MFPNGKSCDVLKLLFPLELVGEHPADCDLEGRLLDAAQTRAQALLAEMIPATAGESLPDWERVLDLPDPCTGPLATIQARRQAVVIKDGAGGGLSRQYYIDLAASLGYAITIDEGVNGDPYTWRVTAGAVPIKYFRAGASAAGDRLQEWGEPLLECVIRRLKPAHTDVIFAYGG
jgi:uncharacterized protein YmfQ (DUF2313 family)